MSLRKKKKMLKSDTTNLKKKKMKSDMKKNKMCGIVLVSQTKHSLAYMLSGWPRNRRNLFLEKDKRF